MTDRQREREREREREPAFDGVYDRKKLFTQREFRKFLLFFFFSKSLTDRREIIQQISFPS